MKKTSNTDPEPQGSPMLEWTGERYLPWIKDAAIAYEHLHRYVFACSLAEGKRVLDLASGEGYGSNLLASKASAVVGVEIDSAAVQHARGKYKRNNLQFEQGSITNLPLQEEHGFDAVVCFEAIEHIAEQQKLVSEAKRMLKPDGIFVVSTPNKQIYQHESHEDNPFHVNELEFPEFRDLLAGFFKNVRFLGQRIFANSSIWPIEGTNSSRIDETVIARNDAEFEFAGNDKRVPLYFIAIASDSPLPSHATGSVLIDSSDQLLNDKAREIRELLETKASSETALAWRESQLAEREQAIIEQQEWYRGQIRELQEGLAWKDGVITDAQATIASHEHGIAWLQGVVAGLEKDKSNLTESLQKTRYELELIHASRGWQWIMRLRRLREKFMGRGKSQS
jgi:O-antigen biosynthesis protein